MWGPINNPFLDTKWMDSQFIAAMKEQERNAILAVLNAKKMTISGEGANLTATLDQKASDMENFASNQMVSNLDEGLQGQAAEAADNFLRNLTRPNLESPVKGG